MKWTNIMCTNDSCVKFMIMVLGKLRDATVIFSATTRWWSRIYTGTHVH